MAARLSSRSAMRSPGRSPASRSARARRAERDSSSPYVTTWPPGSMTIAARSGWRAAWCPSVCGGVCMRQSTAHGHGIGRALCERLARDGARVVVADVHAERAEKIAARIGGTSFVGDVGHPAVVAALVDHAVAHYGPVHVFCSNA